METKANHLAVGAFVLSVIAGLFAFVVWLGKSEIDREFDRYAIYFSGSVSGLTTSSTVRYRGVPVGTVDDIRIDPANSEQVQVTIEVERGTPIKEDAAASLEFQGITGLVDVLISGGGKESPPLKPPTGRKIAVIRSTPSKLEAVFEDVPRALARFTYLVERATLLLSDENLAAITDTLHNVSTLSEAIAASSDDFKSVTGDVAATAAEVRRTAAEINVLVTDLSNLIPSIAGDVSAALKAAEQALNSVGDNTDTLTKTAQAALDELTAMITENRVPFRDFSNEGLYEMSRFLAEARVLVDGLTRIAGRFETDPARFLFGDAQAGFEAQ